MLNEQVAKDRLLDRVGRQFGQASGDFVSDLDESFAGGAQADVALSFLHGQWDFGEKLNFLLARICPADLFVDKLESFGKIYAFI